jgi:putative tricarboxylic transport membrane protein
MISMVGTYASDFSIFQMWMALLIGTVAYILRTQGFPIIPMLMGVILGPYLEAYLRRAMIVGDLNPLIFVTRPVSLALLILCVIFIYFLKIRQSPALKAISKGKK